MALLIWDNSHIIAALLLLMYGDKAEKDILLYEIVTDYERFWSSQAGDIIFGITCRIPPMLDDLPSSSKDIEVDIRCHRP